MIFIYFILSLLCPSPPTLTSGYPAPRLIWWNSTILNSRQYPHRHRLPSYRTTGGAWTGWRWT